MTNPQQSATTHAGGALTGMLNDTLALPAVAAPMFILSGPELVIAQCKAGVGSFPALNARPESDSPSG